MARFELKLPKMGESVAEATITSWLKEVGDTIALDEAIVEIATDKVDSEVPSEVEGTLVEVLFEKDEVVTVGATIAIIETAVAAEVDAATYNLDADGLHAALAAANAQNIEVVGIMCVGLFGQPANITRISAFADTHGLWVLDDAAQSFGSTWKGQQAGTLGHVTATSFFPAKPLGCYGDGGAVLTDDDNIAEIAISCRVHGQGRDKYENERIGMTARLDTIQAAILLSKLSIFDDELAARQQVADRYQSLLGGKITTPPLAQDATSSWAQYVIQLPDGTDRQAVQSRMGAKDIPTAVYYPRPMHTQPPYLRYPVAEGGLSVTERLAGSVLALPMHPYLTPEQQEQVADALMSSL